MTIRVLPTAAAASYASGAGSAALAAAASFTTSVSAITMAAANPGWVVPGMQVLDMTVGAVIGTVASYVGTTLTLTANAAHASSGSSDSLSFSPVPIVIAGTGAQARGYFAAVGMPQDITGTNDVTSGDASVLTSQGFVVLGTSGATSTRPSNPKLGHRHIDTTLDYEVVWDGSAWRNPVTGAAV